MYQGFLYFNEVQMIKITISSLKELVDATASIMKGFSPGYEFNINMNDKEWKDLDSFKKKIVINKFKKDYLHV